jgi:hypothetical protein
MNAIMLDKPVRCLFFVQPASMIGAILAAAARLTCRGW